jgi:hypothetical protein
MASTQMSFCLGTPSWSFEFLEIGTPMTLEAHNVLSKASIKVRFKTKLYPLSKDFQWYVYSMPRACE